ncbi:MAG: DNA-processing protein DprA [Ruminococcus sp.]|nr:DNA-processing protein DprA [Ruminococcus sp.]
MDDRAYWLWLVMVFGPAEPRIWTLSREYDNAKEFYEALQEGEVSELTEDEQKRLDEVELEKAQEIIKRCEDDGIDVLCFDSNDYPDRLRTIYDPPAVLFVRGDPGLIKDRLVVNMAGTRNPSNYSQRITSVLSRKLSANGCVIATGLTDGIDSLAINTSSGIGYPTIGVCGMAIDLYEKKDFAGIISCGFLVSETHSLMNWPRPKFTNRNRIMVGLSDTVVFVEGSGKSRGLDIAEHCISQGKLLFVVPPHDITDTRYLGQAWLIRRGAVPVFSENDILFHLSHLSPERLVYDKYCSEYIDLGDYSFYSKELPDTENSSDTKKRDKARPAKIPVQEDEADEEPAASADLSLLEGKEKEICELLKEKPMLADEIAEKTGLGITEALSVLTSLELDGYVESLSGKRFGLI